MRCIIFFCRKYFLAFLLCFFFPQWTTFHFVSCFQRPSPDHLIPVFGHRRSLGSFCFLKTKQLINKCRRSVLRIVSCHDLKPYLRFKVINLKKKILHPYLSTSHPLFYSNSCVCFCFFFSFWFLSCRISEN